MKKRVMILIALMTATSTYAISLNDIIKPANPLEHTLPETVQSPSSPKKVTLTKNDLHNQYAIALNKYVQSNVKSAYTDFYVMLESATPMDYMYLQMAEKMADLGFFDLSELSISKLQDKDISDLLIEDVKHFYYPSVKLEKDDELYLAEMYSSIVYNDQSREVTAELIKNTNLLQKYDYANYITALGYYKSNNIDEAQKYIDTAIQKNPQNINYKKLKAEIVSQSQKPQNALKIIAEIKSHPFYTTEFTRKINSIEEYVLYKCKKDEFEKKYHLAHYYYLEGELNKSIRTLQTAFNTKKSNNKKIYALMSRVYYDLKEYEKAEDTATKAYKIDKSESEALMVLGDLAYNKKDYQNAMKYYQDACGKDTFIPEIRLAQTCIKIGDKKHAQDLYAKVLKTHSDCYEAYYETALLDKSREVQYLKKSLAINPKFKESWIDLARVDIENGKLDRATQYLAIAKYIDENDFRYYYYQGLVYKNKGLTADAKRSFRKSLSINPDYTPAKEELSI